MHAPLPTRTRFLLLPLLATMTLGGCATKEFVQQGVGAVNQRIDELSGKIATAYQRIDGGALMILDTGKRVGAVEQTATALGQRIDTTQTGLADAGKRLEAMASDLQTAAQRTDANTAEIARAHQRIDAIDDQFTTTQQQVQGTQDRISTAENRIGGLEGALTTLREERNAPRPGPEAAETTVQESAPPAPASGAAAQSASLADSNQRLDEIAIQLSAANQRIDANTAALGTASERVGKVEASLAETATRAESNEAGLAAATKRMDEMKGELATSEQRITSNTQAITVVTQRVDTLQANLDAASAEVSAQKQALAASDARIEQTEAALKQQGERLTKNEADDILISATAKEALDRAIAAGKLAQGKLVLEKVLTEERSGYSPYGTELSDADKEALKQFADKLVAENQNVYLEIQGYTDDSGPRALNLRLSRDRAEKVRAFLHDVGGIPLYRMSVMPYGEAKPVADNSTKEGRNKNRRVVIVVLK